MGLLTTVIILAALGYGGYRIWLKDKERRAMFEQKYTERMNAMNPEAASEYLGTPLTRPRYETIVKKEVLKDGTKEKEEKNIPQGIPSTDRGRELSGDLHRYATRRLDETEPRAEKLPAPFTGEELATGFGNVQSTTPTGTPRLEARDPRPKRSNKKRSKLNRRRDGFQPI